MRYVSRPQTVEAIQYGPEWTPQLVGQVAEFIAGRPLTVAEAAEYVLPDMESDPPEFGTALILAGKDGAQGWVPVPLGHWIVRSAGDFTDHWPVDPDYFAAKYEPEEGSP
jgi:hypothetical protein